MATQNHILEGEDGMEGAGAHINQHVSKCKEITGVFAHKAFDSFVQVFLSELSQAANQSADHIHIQAMLGAEKKISVEKNALQAQFAEELKSRFDDFTAGTLMSRLKETGSNKDQLKLLENEILEESIALKAIVQKLDLKYTDQLWLMHQRLTLLNDGEHVEEQTNPVSPVHLCYAMAATLRPCSFSFELKRMAFNLFGDILMLMYGPFANELNTSLAAGGLMPNLTYDPRVVKSKSAKKKVTPDGSQAVPADKEESLMKAILQLQSGAVKSEKAPGDAQPVSMDQLIKALERIQDKEVGDNKSVLPAENLKNVLDSLSQATADPSKGKISVLSEEYNSVIDLVGMVFEFILNDEALPATVKTWLSYLHTPFLKLAFQDPSFIEKNNHPARALLNALAEAGSKWIGNDGTVQYGMDEKIKRAVNNVLSGQAHTAVVNETLKEFKAHVATLERKNNLLERRATEKMQGVEKLQQTKNTVFMALMDRVKSKAISKAALMFILQPWSDYLSFMLLRHGEKSELWISGLQVVEDLVWSLQPNKSAQDLARQRQLFPELMKQITQGFAAIGFDPKKGKALTSSIVLDISKVQKGLAFEALSPEALEDQLHQFADKNGVTIVDQETMSQDEQKLVDNLSMIEFGTWFEFEGGKRLKAAWYNAQTSQYMFVDQMGKQERLMTGLELARQMIAKKAKIIAGSSKPFFERALETIFQKLNDNN